MKLFVILRNDIHYDTVPAHSDFLQQILEDKEKNGKRGLFHQFEVFEIKANEIKSVGDIYD